MIELLVIAALAQTPIDIELAGPPSAAVGEIVNMKISVANHSPDVGTFSLVNTILSWDPSALEPLSFTTCDSFYPWFLVMAFVSSNPDNNYVECINEDADLDGWPDNDGDMGINHIIALGQNANAFNVPSNISTVHFRVLRTGSHTVAMVPETECPLAPVVTHVLDLANVDVTGDITDTYTVEVRSPFDVIEPAGVGIEDLLALLAAWGTEPQSAMWRGPAYDDFDGNKPAPYNPDPPRKLPVPTYPSGPAYGGPNGHYYDH